MDAFAGVDVLGLQWMRDERPHCGFPEVNYSQHAETLARSGMRVVVVEQTETPEQLEKRNQQRKAQGLTKVCGTVPQRHGGGGMMNALRIIPYALCALTIVWVDQ